MKKGRKRRGEVVWLGILSMFSGSMFLDVIFESPLFPPDSEADVFVEVYVAARSDVDIVFILCVYVSFHCLSVAECFSQQPFRPWPRRFDAEAFQKLFDVCKQFIVCVRDSYVSILADRSF